MWNNGQQAARAVDTELPLKDLLSSMTTCWGIDPGPDPTSDPDDFPEWEQPSKPEPEPRKDDGDRRES